MKSARLATALLFFISAQLYSSVPDSLIRFNDLVFKSEFEKTTFINCAANPSTDLVDIFLASYIKETNINSLPIHQKINDCVNILRNQIAGKSEPKKVKAVYDYVHKRFFKVFKLKNSFCDIFSVGEYNCVSASALYAIVFSKLDIPYQIKETPQHVYLEAYPNSNKILIETTIPDKGYYKFSDEFAEQYVKNMYEEKIISKQEKDTSSVTDLFNKYYFSSEDISLIQLAGLQYSNFGIYDADEKKYSSSIDEFKKAYFLNPSERHKFILKLMLLQEISNNNYEDMAQVHHLALLCRYNNLKDNEISDEIIRNEFSRLMRSQLINNSDYMKFDSSYFIISDAVRDTIVKNNIDYSYHYELARLGFISSKDTSYELKHLQRAYAVNPRNADIQSLIIAYFARFAEKSNDPSVIMNLIGLYSGKFSFLNDNENINAVKANCFLELSFRNFVTDNFSKGDNYLKEFEGLVERQKKFLIDGEYVEKAYSTAAGVCFKKGNYSKSKQYVKTGLTYAPESFRLKQMLSQY